MKKLSIIASLLLVFLLCSCNLDWSENMVTTTVFEKPIIDATTKKGSVDVDVIYGAGNPLRLHLTATVEGETAIPDLIEHNGEVECSVQGGRSITFSLSGIYDDEYNVRWECSAGTLSQTEGFSIEYATLPAISQSTVYVYVYKKNADWEAGILRIIVSSTE